MPSLPVDTVPPEGEPGITTTGRFRADELAIDRALLVETTGPTPGRVHEIAEGTSTLGRLETCTIRFEDPTLSRVHARLHRSGNSVVVEDAGSLNGSFVGDRRVERAELHDGDRVRLGATTQFRFQLATAAEARALVTLYESSVRDGLTLLYNRSYLENVLAAELSYARRHGAPVAVLLVDVDHFKRINDTWGHLAGDAVLREIAAVAMRTVRLEDVVARYGGEELCVVVREGDFARAAPLAERLRVAIEELRVPVGDEHVAVTVSIGVATTEEPGLDVAPEVLLARADARLYEAKARGRNRVVSTGIPEAPSRARTRRSSEE